MKWSSQNAEAQLCSRPIANSANSADRSDVEAIGTIGTIGTGFASRTPHTQQSTLTSATEQAALLPGPADLAEGDHCDRTALAPPKDAAVLLDECNAIDRYFDPLPDKGAQ